MANKRITELNITTDPQASDVFAIVNNNETKKVTYGSIRDTIHTSYNSGSFLITSSLDDHTITFTKGDGTQYQHLLPGGQGSPSTNHYLIPEFITVSGSSSEPYPHFYLTGSAFENTAMIKVDWTGPNGTAHIVLPDATTAINRYRSIRLTMGADFDSNTKGILFADVHNLSQTLDGSSGGYTLSKPYEGIMVWSDGSNWIRIQTKA